MQNDQRNQCAREKDVARNTNRAAYSNKAFARKLDDRSHFILGASPVAYYSYLVAVLIVELIRYARKTIGDSTTVALPESRVQSPRIALVPAHTASRHPGRAESKPPLTGYLAGRPATPFTKLGFVGAVRFYAGSGMVCTASPSPGALSRRVLILDACIGFR
jgi:hypothetical protein